MKIHIITILSIFFCIMLQGAEKKDNQLLIVDTSFYQNNMPSVDFPIAIRINNQLIEACCEGNAEMVEKLLKAGANPFLVGFTLIHEQPKIGMYQDTIVSYAYPKTALSEASERGHKDCMQLLIEYGVNPFKIDNYYIIQENNLNLCWDHDDENKAPINYAIEQKHTNCVKMLFEHALQQDKKLHKKVLLAEYFKAAYKATLYKEYVGKSSYKEYLQKNITFLLLVNKFSTYKSVHHPRLLLPKPLLLEIVRLNLYNTYPVLSEALKVASSSVKNSKD